MKQATQKDPFVFEMREKCKSNFSKILKKPCLNRELSNCDPYWKGVVTGPEDPDSIIKVIA